MAATVDDVEAGYGEDNLGVSSQISDVLVQGDSLLGGSSFADGERHSKDGVSSQLG